MIFELYYYIMHGTKTCYMTTKFCTPCFKESSINVGMLYLTISPLQQEINATKILKSHS
jgi:hypothetical protein